MVSFFNAMMFKSSYLAIQLSFVYLRNTCRFAANYNIMEETRSQNKAALSYGAFYGLSGVVVFMLFYLMGTNINSKAPQYIGYLLLIFFIIIGIKSHRDADLNGFISYSKSLGTGTLIGLYGGIITGAFSVLFFQYISPESMQQIMEAAQQNMADRGMTEEQMQMGLEYTKKFTQPMWLFVFSALGAGLMGFIFSLIISVFMKKESTPFNSNLG